MRIDELVSPAQSPPREKEKKRRMEIAMNILNMVMKANPTSMAHTNVFILADKAAGEELNASPLELKRDDVLRRTRLNMIANSPLNIVKLHSIQKKMEKILRK